MNAHNLIIKVLQEWAQIANRRISKGISINHLVTGSDMVNMADSSQMAPITLDN